MTYTTWKSKVKKKHKREKKYVMTYTYGVCVCACVDRLKERATERSAVDRNVKADHSSLWMMNEFVAGNGRNTVVWSEASNFTIASQRGYIQRWIFRRFVAAFCQVTIWTCRWQFLYFLLSLIVNVETVLANRDHVGLRLGFHRCSWVCVTENWWGAVVVVH